MHDCMKDQSLAVQVRYAIYCAQAVGGGGPIWDRWAAAWLSGDDRSSVRARAAWAAAKGEHADRSVVAARAAWAAEAAVVATWAKDAAWVAWAEDAAWAAATLRPGLNLDLLAIAKRAAEDETGAQPQGEKA